MIVPSRFDFHKDQLIPFFHDQIDLAATDGKVLFHRTVASFFQNFTGESFAVIPCFLAILFFHLTRKVLRWIGEKPY